MGTRNLTCVYINGEYRVAQYGQWDGYPEGQGATILNFLKGENNIENLKSAMNKVRFLDLEGKDKEFLEEYNRVCPQWGNEPDNRTEEQKRWFESYQSRDIGGKILQTIIESHDSEILLANDLDFAADSLFCEWAYVVDLDKNTFEVYKGFNKTSLYPGEKFSDLKCDGEYYPVKLMQSYSLDDLPELEDMIQDCDPPEEE